MATATVSSSSSTANHLHTDSLPVIDLRLLSHTELLSLSLCSSSSGSFTRGLRQNEADVATLKIDRSVFNESAGSRKQTFSRLRLAPPRNKSSSQFSPSPSNRNYQRTVEFAPQDEENSQIVFLLKSLFGSNNEKDDNDNRDIEVYSNDNDKIDMFSDDDLFFVPITYNESFEAMQNLSVANYSDRTNQAIVAESFSNKRKRGRPRKSWSNDNYNANEVVEKVKDEEEATNTDSKRKRGRPRKNWSDLAVNNNDNKCDVHAENVNDEREVIGVESGMEVEPSSGGGGGEKEDEDWFGEELRRRTTGMQTEMEVSGVLEVLEGEWVSKRKKRKIVDARVLRDVLPEGWKVIVCNKRRAGYFWLACTGYISPKGQQFMSSKEVSSHLLSGELQDANQSSLGPVDSSAPLAVITSFRNAVDVTRNNRNKNGDDLICCSTLPVTESVEHEKQATTLEVGIPGQVQAVEKYKCHKCTMAFEGPDDLLQHLLSSHQRVPKKLRQETSMNEEVIIKNGKYECQFCQKTFEERHRFNGHLGNHIKDYFKRIEASGGVMAIQRITVPPSIGVHSDVLQKQESIGVDLGSVAIHSDIKTSGEISCAVLSCEIKENSDILSHCGEQDMVCSMTSDKAEKTNEITDVTAVEVNICSGVESTLPNNDNYSICKSPNETTKLNSTIIMNKINSHKEGSQNCSTAAFGRDHTRATDNNKDQVITSLMDGQNQERDSDIHLPILNSEHKAFGGEKMKDRLLFSTTNGMKLDERDFVWKDKLTGSRNYCSLQEDASANIKEQRSSEGCSFVPYVSEQQYGSVGNDNGLSTSITAEMTHEGGSKGALLPSLDEKTCLWNNKVNQVSTSMVSESAFIELGKPRNNVQTVGFGNNKTLTVEDAMTGCEPESSLGSCSVIPSWNEQTCFTENDINGTRRSPRKKHWQEEESEGSQLALFGSGQSFGLDNNNTVKVSTNWVTGNQDHDEVQHSKNNGRSKDDDLVVGCVINNELERSTNNFSLDPAGGELTIAIRDKEVLNVASKNLAQGRSSESSLLRKSYGDQTLNNESNVNIVSFIPMDQNKNKEVNSFRHVEPYLVSYHNLMERGVDIMKNCVEENYSKNSSFITSGNQQKFSLEDNVTDLYHNTVGEQKKASIESMLRLSCSDQDSSVNNSSNMVWTLKVQEKPRTEDLCSREKESAIGFDSHNQVNEKATTSEFMWRIDEENDLLSGFPETSSQLVHSSGCFPTYDVMSDKGESEFFGEKFSGISGYEGLRSGSMENMEYDFMTSHSDESKVFTYNADIAQGLESSVWLEKEALPLLPKITSRHHFRTYCVWCRNEFQCETLASEAQVGSFGVACAACKAKFSGQFNL